MSTTTRTGDYDHCAYVHEKVGIRCGGYRKGHEERYVDHPFTEAATLPPEQSAPEADEWRVEHFTKDGASEWMVVTGITGRTVALSNVNDSKLAESEMRQIVTDHARAALVPGLVEALRAAIITMQFAGDSNEEVVTDRATVIKESLAVIEAARKAGVE